MFMTSFHKRQREAWWEWPGGSGLVGAAASRCCPAVSRYFLHMLPVTLPSFGSVITLECLLFSAARPLSSGLSAPNNADKTGAGAARRAANEVAEGHSVGEKKESSKEEGGGGLLASRVKGQGPLKQHFGRLKLTAITSRTHSHTLRLTQRQNGLDSSSSTN